MEKVLRKRSNDNVRFLEKELWYIGKSLAELGSYLENFTQKSKISYGGFSLNNITLSPQGYLKLYTHHISINNRHTSFYMIMNALTNLLGKNKNKSENDKEMYSSALPKSYKHQKKSKNSYTQTQRIFFLKRVLQNGIAIAPEYIQSFINLNFTKYKDSNFKADVFSLGMVLLQLITDQNIAKFYSFEKDQINELIMKFDIQNVHSILLSLKEQKVYSQHLIQIVYNMLNPNSLNRPSFEQVIEFIDKNRDQISIGGCINIKMIQQQKIENYENSNFIQNQSKSLSVNIQKRFPFRKYDTFDGKNIFLNDQINKLKINVSANENVNTNIKDVSSARLSSNDFKKPQNVNLLNNLPSHRFSQGYDNPSQLPSKNIKERLGFLTITPIDFLTKQTNNNQKLYNQNSKQIKIKSLTPKHISFISNHKNNKQKEIPFNRQYFSNNSNHSLPDKNNNLTQKNQNNSSISLSNIKIISIDKIKSKFIENNYHKQIQKQIENTKEVQFQLYPSPIYLSILHNNSNQISKSINLQENSKNIIKDIQLDKTKNQNRQIQKIHRKSLKSSLSNNSRNKNKSPSGINQGDKYKSQRIIGVTVTTKDRRKISNVSNLIQKQKQNLQAKQNQNQKNKDKDKDKSITCLKSFSKNKKASVLSSNKNRTFSTLNNYQLNNQNHNHNILNNNLISPNIKDFNQNFDNKNNYNNHISNQQKPNRILINVDQSQLNIMNHTGYFGGIITDIKKTLQIQKINKSNVRTTIQQQHFQKVNNININNNRSNRHRTSFSKNKGKINKSNDNTNLRSNSNSNYNYNSNSNCKIHQLKSPDYKNNKKNNLQNNNVFTKINMNHILISPSFKKYQKQHSSSLSKQKEKQLFTNINNIHEKCIPQKITTISTVTLNNCSMLQRRKAIQRSQKQKQKQEVNFLNNCLSSNNKNQISINSYCQKQKQKSILQHSFKFNDHYQYRMTTDINFQNKNDQHYHDQNSYHCHQYNLKKTQYNYQQTFGNNSNSNGKIFFPR